MNEMTLNKSCLTCGAWQSALETLGDCRKNAPAFTGWPKTVATDWCCQWIKDQRPRAPKPAESKRWQVGINYVFVRDYPDLANRWLLAAVAQPERIPVELHPILANPLGNVLTDYLPDWVDGAPCCERLLSQCEQLPGFCNDDAADDDEYCGLLMSMASATEIAASQLALTQIPAGHPWRQIDIGAVFQKKGTVDV